MTGDMTIKRHDDGSIEVLRADDEIEVANHFVDAPGSVDERMSMNGDVFQVIASNGVFRYRVHDADTLRDTYRASRLREDNPS